MTRFDLSPFLRSTVGFDRMTRLLEESHSSGDTGYPPYNIIQQAENQYQIAMAVAGFSEDNLEITAKNNMLIVKGSKDTEDKAEEKTYLHQGIAARGFERHFQIADHIRIEEARLENGMLYIDLVRELPEKMKPRKISIETGKTGSKKALLGGGNKSNNEAA